MSDLLFKLYFYDKLVLWAFDVPSRVRCREQSQQRISAMFDLS